MEARYRSDYPGEFVVVESRWTNGRKEQTREWIDNPINNQHISGRAACIISDLGKEFFDYTHLQKHKGGLLGSKKLQTYGVGNIIKEMRLDFAVELQKDKLDEIKDTGYQVNNVVYTTARQCLIHPGEFYLIPHNPMLSQEALTLYLAAFDGHKEIFMFGFKLDTPGSNSAWISQVNNIIKTYTSATFIAVTAPTTTPKCWGDNPNFKHMTVREFISYCDV